MSHFTVVRTKFSTRYEDILEECLERRGCSIRKNATIRDEEERTMKVPLAFTLLRRTFGIRRSCDGKTFEFVGDIFHRRKMLGFLNRQWEAWPYQLQGEGAQSLRPYWS